MLKLACLGIVLVAITYFRYPMNISIDPAMYLQAGELLLQGKRPYVDFLEINPPLIFYLNTLPVLLAKYTGLSVILAFKVILLGLMGCMGICLVRILSTHPLVSRFAALCIIGFYFLIPILLMFVVAAGQREHLFMIAFAPYFYMRTSNLLQPKPIQALSLFVSFFCALMACLKPQFIFIVVCLEFSLVYLRHSFRTLFQKDVYVFGAVVLLYCTHFLLLPTEVRHAFFNDLVPQIVSHYQSFGRSPINLLNFRWHYWVTAVSSVVLLLCLRANKISREMNFALAVFGISALIVYFAQGKGWFYHFIPLIYSSALAIPWICYGVRFAKSFWLRSLSFVFVCTIISYTGSLTYKTVKGLIYPRYMKVMPHYGIDDVKESIATYSAVGDSIVVFSPSPIYSYPAFVQQGRTPGTRYLFHFPMSFYNSPLETDESQPYPYKTREQMDPAEVRYLEQIKSDMIQNKPQLLIFTTYRHEYDFLPDNFDPYQYFVTNGLWTDFASQYTLVAEKLHLKVFQKNGIHHASMDQRAVY